MRRSQQARAAIVIAQRLFHDRGHPRPFFVQRRAVVGTGSGRWSLGLGGRRADIRFTSMWVVPRWEPSRFLLVLTGVVNLETDCATCVGSPIGDGATVPWDSQPLESIVFLGMSSTGASLFSNGTAVGTCGLRCIVTEPNGRFRQYSRLRRLSRSGSGGNCLFLTAQIRFPASGSDPRRPDHLL